jgi:acetolactate synthase-1/3 small subunit
LWAVADAIIIIGLFQTAQKPSKSFMRHVLSAIVQNVPGVLAHISGMLASRGYNIDSLAVGETETPHLSRMTFVLVGPDSVLEQVRKQLEKIVTVVQVVDISSQDFVERDLMLIKVLAEPGGRRSEIHQLAEIFRGRVVDVAPGEVIVEISGPERKVEAFIDLMRPFGIVELVRTGRIAMVRGQQKVSEPKLAVTASADKTSADKPAAEKAAGDKASADKAKR